MQTRISPFSMRTAIAWRRRSRSICFSHGLHAAEGRGAAQQHHGRFLHQAGRPNEFGLVGATANAIAPNKRSLSSMSPTFVRDAERHDDRGSPGGSYIISMVLLGTSIIWTA